MRTLLGTSFCRLCDALSQLFAERSVPCEHLTAEIPIKQLIFSIQIAKSGCKLIKFSASSSIQLNECRASRHCQIDRENHDKRCAVLRHVLSFRVRSEVERGCHQRGIFKFFATSFEVRISPGLLGACSAQNQRRSAGPFRV